MTWELKQTLLNLVKDEINLENPGEYGSRDINFAIVYPNTYDVAMSNLGYQSIYSQLNRRGDVVCHRAVLPNIEQISRYQNKTLPLLALESLKPVCNYDIVGFSISFELDYINVLKFMKMAHIPAYSSERKHMPLVIAGGPAVTFNPEPLSLFIDAFVIGEGEDVIHEIIDEHIKSKMHGKIRVLEEWAKIPGVYIPSFYEPEYNNNRFVGMKVKNKAPKTIRKRWIKDLNSIDTSTRIITKNTEFKDMFLVELSRGCGRGCRFCMAGYCYRLPRNRTREKVLKICEEGSEYVHKIGLVGAAVSDYPYIDELIADILERKLKFSVASLRADSLTETLAYGLAASGHKTLTIAPEAASERMRKIINKGITEQNVYKAVNLAAQNGIGNIRMYFIIGFPGERMEDLKEMIILTKNVREILNRNRLSGRITLSINPFVPKPFTPFQWSPFENLRRLQEKRRYIEKCISAVPNTKIIFQSPQWSLVQTVLARGSRIIGDVLLDVCFSRGSFGRWKSAFDRYGLDIHDLAYEHIPYGESLPWDHLDIGIEKKFFIDEDKRAVRGIAMPRCTDERCMLCNICFKN